MWELIFLLVIMKIPIAYLCLVVWWAVKAEPLPPEGAGVHVRLPDVPPREPHRPFVRRPRRPGPHGSPRRGYARPGRAAPTRVAAER